MCSPSVYFLRVWLNGIIAIRNSNDDSTSPWKMPLWIFTADKFFFPSSSQFHFPWLPWWSLWFCRISCTFSDELLSRIVGPYHRPFSFSIHTMTTFFRLVLLSLRMHWLVYSKSLFPLFSRIILSVLLGTIRGTLAIDLLPNMCD